MIMIIQLGIVISFLWEGHAVSRHYIASKENIINFNYFGCTSVMKKDKRKSLYSPRLKNCANELIVDFCWKFVGLGSQHQIILIVIFLIFSVFFFAPETLFLRELRSVHALGDGFFFALKYFFTFFGIQRICCT